ncbi:MAG TPA: DNA polymerase III subunit delta [Ruminiclostridium sp.]|nr:DNA polymerase III subunit delta [Ruminiclostridium sp.]
MSIETLKNHIKTGSFLNLYIIYGDEDYLKSYYCKKITDKAVAGFESFNLQKFDGTPDLAQLAAAVNNLPLMSPKKCVLIKDADIKGMKAGEWKELQGIIKSLPPECIMIFHFDAIKLNEKKDERFKSLLTLAKKDGLAVQINSPSKTDILKFLAKRAHENSCEIDAPTAEYLLEICGEGLNNLGCELDKVCALSDSGKITKEQIDAVAVKPVTSSIYDLARAVTGGRLNLAMKIIDELFYKKEEPVIILSALSGTFCDLYRAKAAMVSGAGEASVVKDFNYHGREFRVRNAMRDARNLDITFLAETLSLLMQADAKIKSTKANKRTVLEELIIEISRAGTKAVRR